MSAKYCPDCGKELINPNAVACPNCGAAIKTPSHGGNKRKNPWIGVILSFFWGGVGQMYNGQIGKGIIYLIITLLIMLLDLFLILFTGNNIVILNLLWRIFAMVDAYITATKLNRGEPADKFINLR
jgi:TM2 domain-containing membrane protein YozV